MTEGVTMKEHIILHFQNEPLALDALTILTAMVVLGILIWYVTTLYPARNGVSTFRRLLGSMRQSPPSGAGRDD